MRTRGHFPWKVQRAFQHVSDVIRQPVSPPLGLLTHGGWEGEGYVPEEGAARLQSRRRRCELCTSRFCAHETAGPQVTALPGAGGVHPRTCAVWAPREVRLTARLPSTVQGARNTHLDHFSGPEPFARIEAEVWSLQGAKETWQER